MKSINILEKKVTKLVGILFCMFAFVLFAPSVAAAGPTVEEGNEEWNEPTYTWSADNREVTAKRTSKGTESKIESETVKTIVVTKDPTCTEAGVNIHTAVFKNTAFKTQTKEVRISEPLGHKEETIPGKAATCTKSGLTEGKKCSVCEAVLEEPKEIPALGHDFNNKGVCTRCEAVKIIFEKNGEDVTGTMELQIVEKEEKKSAILNTNEFKRKGYVFTGWNTKADGTDVWYANEASVSLVEGITLHAQWVVKVKSKKYIVAFNGNGGTGKMSAQKSKKRSITLKKNNFRRTGYVFAGWNDKADGTGKRTYKNQATIKLKKNETELILYAQWKEKSEANGSAAAAVSEGGPYVVGETYESEAVEFKFAQKAQELESLPPGVSPGDKVGADENYVWYEGTLSNGEKMVYYTFDLKLLANINGGDEFEVKIDEDGKSVAITIPYPKGIDRSTPVNNIKIYHLVDRKWQQITKFSLEKDGITFWVSSLSPFAIVVKQTSAQKDVDEDFSHICKTADVVTVRELYELGVLSMIALVGLCLSRRRKKI